MKADRWTKVALLVLIVAHGILLGIRDFASRPTLTLGALTFAFVVFVIAARRWERTTSVVFVLSAAALLRVLLLPLVPTTLSDDILRYVWDGRVLAAGMNPYLHPPEAPELADLRDELWQKMPHQHVPTVYPPLAQVIFRLGAALPAPLLGIKILLVFADLVGCFFLLRLAGVLGLPAGRTIWYAWNPLVVVEIAGMGHVDTLVVLGSVGAVLALASARPGLGGAAAAAGVLGKLSPLVALPLWTLHAGSLRSGARFALVAALCVVAACVPVVVSVGGVPPGLVMYGVSWEFNGPLFEPLWRAFDAVHLDERVKSVLDVMRERDGRDQFWYRFYPYIYPQFLAKVVLLGLFGILFLLSLRPSGEDRARRLVIGSGRLFGAVLLCSATLYPWYLIWVLPWAALARHRAWLALSGLVQLVYVSHLTGVEHFPWLFWGLWIPFFLLLVTTRWTMRPSS